MFQSLFFFLPSFKGPGLPFCVERRSGTISGADYASLAARAGRGNSGGPEASSSITLGPFSHSWQPLTSRRNAPAGADDDNRPEAGTLRQLVTDNEIRPPE